MRSGTGGYLFFSLPERGEKIESHAVRSSKRGRWFPEIKNKARGKGAIGRQIPAAHGETHVPFSKAALCLSLLSPEPQASEPAFLPPLEGRSLCTPSVSSRSLRSLRQSPVRSSLPGHFPCCSCLRTTPPPLLEPNLPFQLLAHPPNIIPAPKPSLLTAFWKPLNAISSS